MTLTVLSRCMPIAAACLCFLFGLGSDSRADTVTTFNFTGTFDDAGPVFTPVLLPGATVTIDTTTGQVLSEQFTIANTFFSHTTATFTPSPSEISVIPLGGDILIEAVATNNFGSFGGTIELQIDNLNSLVGYNGGNVDVAIFNAHGDTWSASDDQVANDDIFNGRLAPAPEPGTLSLLAAGMLTCGGIGFRRRRERKTES